MALQMHDMTRLDVLPSASPRFQAFQTPQDPQTDDETDEEQLSKRALKPWMPLGEPQSKAATGKSVANWSGR